MVNTQAGAIWKELRKRLHTLTAEGDQELVISAAQGWQYRAKTVHEIFVIGDSETINWPSGKNTLRGEEGREEERTEGRGERRKGNKQRKRVGGRKEGEKEGKKERKRVEGEKGRRGKRKEEGRKKEGRMGGKKKEEKDGRKGEKGKRKRERRTEKRKMLTFLKRRPESSLIWANRGMMLLR